MKPQYPLPEPKTVWTRFFELVAVPRPSKAEGAAIDYLQKWAEQHKFEARKDGVGNLVVHVPAAGKHANASATPLLLQCHVDIVAVTARDAGPDVDAARGLIPTVRGDIDPSNAKRLSPNPNGDWIMAEQTTLGADNGIGVAMMMALAEDADRPLPLELLFTIDEEAGMTGASGLDPQALGITGKQLINIDTEEDTEITVGAAGGRDATFQWSSDWESSGPADLLRLSISGLKGGHSGVEINQGRANANRLIARAVYHLSTKMPIQLVSMRGGSRRNAIPDHCEVVVAVPKEYLSTVPQFIQDFTAQINQLYAGRDNKVSVGIEAVAAVSNVRYLSTTSTRQLLNLLCAIPTGICEMTPEIVGLVESSCNMAIVEIDASKPIEIICSVRGTTRSAIDDICDSLKSIADLTRSSLQFGDGYPGWKPSLGSTLLNVAIAEYKRIFSADAQVHAVHAGLECGLLIEKLPDLQAISIGPTIKGNHAVGERVQISSVEKSYRYLRAILEKLSK